MMIEGLTGTGEQIQSVDKNELCGVLSRWLSLLVYVIRWFSGLSVNQEITNLSLDGLKTHTSSARLL